MVSQEVFYSLVITTLLVLAWVANSERMLSGTDFRPGIEAFVILVSMTAALYSVVFTIVIIVVLIFRFHLVWVVLGILAFFGLTAMVARIYQLGVRRPEEAKISSRAIEKEQSV